MKYLHRIQHVFASSARNPSWSYTIGFPEHYGHPEVVVSSLDPLCLNLLADEIMAGARFQDGSRSETLFNYPVVFKLVPPELHGPEVTLCTQHHGTRPFDLLQMVWCDVDGRFPWEKGYINRPAQHQLWRPGGARGHGRLRRTPDPAPTPIVAPPRLAKPVLAARWDRGPWVDGTH